MSLGLSVTIQIPKMVSDFLPHQQVLGLFCFKNDHHRRRRRHHYNYGYF